MIDLQPKNSTLLERLVPFVVARPSTVKHFDMQPFGIDVEETLDPLRASSEPFLHLLENLDQVTFGPTGMPMPRWVFLDGSEMTGGIVGFALPSERASESIRELLSVPAGYQGLVPLSVYIAIPTFERGVWFGHNLASAAGLLPDQNLSGLGSLTKALALKMYRATRQVGATQWPSKALYVHWRLGPMRLLTASTPAHGDDDTLTYEVDITDDVLRHVARDPRGKIPTLEPDEWLSSDDADRIIGMQAEIESGARYAIVGRPEAAGDGTQKLPIARLAQD